MLSGALRRSNLGRLRDSDHYLRLGLRLCGTRREKRANKGIGLFAGRRCRTSRKQLARKPNGSVHLNAVYAQSTTATAATRATTSVDRKAWASLDVRRNRDASCCLFPRSGPPFRRRIANKHGWQVDSVTSVVLGHPLQLDSREKNRTKAAVFANVEAMGCRRPGPKLLRLRPSSLAKLTSAGA